MNRDGSFRIGGLQPGVLNIYVDHPSAPGFMLLRIEAEGTPPNQAVTVTAGQPLNGVRLVFAYGTAVIRGQAQIINGSLPTGARTSVSARRTDVTDRSLQGRFAEVDARGHFVLEGLPAGEYEITLSSYGPRFATPGAPPPSRPLIVKQKVIVPATGEVVVTMTLDVAANQNPPKEK